MARNKYNIDEELDVPFNWAQFKRSLVYIKKYKKSIFLMFLFSVIASLLGLVTPKIQAYVIDELIPGNLKGLIIVLGVSYFAVSVAIVFINRLRAKISAKTGQSIITDMRTDVFSHLQKLSFDYYDSRPHGKILTRVINYVNNVADFLTNGMINAVLQIINLFLILGFMLSISVRMTLVVLAGLPFFYLYVRITKPRQRRFRQLRANKQSNTTAYLAENINGEKVTQAFVREEMNEGIFNGLLDETKKYSLRAAYLAHGMWPISTILSRIVRMAIYIAAIYLFRDEFILEGVVQIGAITAMIAYSNRFWGPIQQLGNIYNQLLDTAAYLERIFQVLDEPVTVDDAEDAYPLPEIQGAVEFENVMFEYEKGTPVLKNVSFKVAPGESIALVGPTGAGKSTIVNLLSRFYNITEGRILIDGNDLSKVTIRSLRQQTGVMLQDTFIFSGTIMDNIRYGRLNATDEECIAAAKAVHADDFIRTMEKGYDTPTNERGAGLSAGQRQLISFARTLLSDPRILILDEATSSIDTNTERLVQEGIAALLKNRTSFIVAHRLSTIQNCDRIMYIEAGQIAEAGSHEELLKKKGLYYDLYMSQRTAFLKETNGPVKYDTIPEGVPRAVLV
ncbi:MAG: ABC transporter ATP-binding protein [Lachnospiraceae bacterium]|nr:ABC transporter ATP-binding protein [Lachnospiraceae bacterium]